tara:strand:- start:6312 stop:8000 length:1689 start_codon:yes stop_codon:yes gene_type:complete
MIHNISSSLSSFKELKFKTGLNVLIAKKESGASDKQTRNRAGKSSLIETIHFLLGANAKPDSIFRSNALTDEAFKMEFDLGGKPVSVERSGHEKSKVLIDSEKKRISEWIERLGEDVFDQKQFPDEPTFRSLIPYFVRRQASSAFVTPEKQAEMQQRGNWQKGLFYLFGLDWSLCQAWQGVREREKTLKELKKAAKKGAFGSIIGKAADLLSELTIAESQLNNLSNQIATFRVLPQYRKMEQEANHLTHSISGLSNANLVDNAAMTDLEAALDEESEEGFSDLKAVFEEAGLVLPGVALKRYKDVESFHQSVVRNRNDYLQEELDSAKQRIADREQEKAQLDEKRSSIMQMLQTHGALEQFAKLQNEAVKIETEVSALRGKYESARQLESSATELDLERDRLTQRLRRDFTEQESTLKEVILAYQAVSSELYDSAGSMSIKDTANGPEFDFSIQGSRSKGIKSMQIFCFDMMLATICGKRGIGPGFLIHDSHLFDGVDGRQVISALKIGSETAAKHGFQYIVTMNEDDAFKERIDGFELKNYINSVQLTDAKVDGGLFGIRF